MTALEVFAKSISVFCGGAMPPADACREYADESRREALISWVRAHNQATWATPERVIETSLRMSE